jgi:2-polyprenyl-3-methyl-5-hydroxy-6-metoxy-1,4-benzoquinol methylase
MTFPWYIRFYHRLFSEETQVKLFLKGKLHEIRDFLKGKHYKSLLEIGSAEGYLSRWLLQQDLINKAVASDIRAHALVAGRQKSKQEKLAKHITFKKFSATSIPFPRKSFDIVLLPDVLEHLSSPQEVAKALQEARRVAKKAILIILPQITIRKPQTLFFLLEPDHLRVLARNRKMSSIYRAKQFSALLKKLNFKFTFKEGRCNLSYYFIKL